MRKPVPVLKVGDKVTEYSEHEGVRRIGVVTKHECYDDGRWYLIQHPGMKFETAYRASNLRENCRYGHGRYVRYIRPYEDGDEYKLALSSSKDALRGSWDNVVEKITTMEQCEELKRIFEEIAKEYDDAKKQKND